MTVTDAVPVVPSLVALIVAVPTPAPVTVPLVETAAIFASLVLHATGRPTSRLPEASLGIAVACIDRPTLSVGGSETPIVTTGPDP